MAIWNILETFWIFYDHLVQFVFIWYILSGFGIMQQEKSGNPDHQFYFWVHCGSPGRSIDVTLTATSVPTQLPTQLKLNATLVAVLDFKCIVVFT
jgi:hypothetical protein